MCICVNELLATAGGMRVAPLRAHLLVQVLRLLVDEAGYLIDNKVTAPR